MTEALKGTVMNAQSLAEKLEKYPHLKERFESILNIVENSSLELADEAEMQAIEEVRKIGNQIMQCWAINQEKIQEQKAEEKNPKQIKHSKKNCIG